MNTDLIPTLLFGVMGTVALILGTVGMMRHRQLDRDADYWRQRAEECERVTKGSNDHSDALESKR